MRLSVADDGCGMSDEIKSQIFDPFFSTKERGTGLGLAVVRQIVEACGGRVEVHTRNWDAARASTYGCRFDRPRSPRLVSGNTVRLIGARPNRKGDPIAAGKTSEDR